MCWSRSPRSSPRLLSQRRRRRSPASQRFTSSVTRRRRRRPDPTRTALPRPRSTVRPPLRQHPLRPAARTAHPPTKHEARGQAPPSIPVTRWQPNFMVLCLSFFLFHANSTKKRKKNDLTSDKVYEEQPDYQHPLSYIHRSPAHHCCFLCNLLPLKHSPIGCLFQCLFV